MSNVDQTDATDVRFSMRSMLISTAVIAAGCTAFGIFLKQFPRDAQSRILIFWGVILAIWLGIVLLMARRRYLAEQHAGAVQFELVPYSYFFPKAPRFAAMMAGTFLLALAPAMAVAYSFAIASAKAHTWWFALDLNSYFIVFGSAAGVTYFWWGRRIRFGDHGVVLRYRYLPWENFRRWYWDPCHRGAIVMEFQQGQRVAAGVPSDQRETVEALLNEKLKMVPPGQMLNRG